MLKVCLVLIWELDMNLVPTLLLTSYFNVLLLSKTNITIWYEIIGEIVLPCTADVVIEGSQFSNLFNKGKHHKWMILGKDKKWRKRKSRSITYNGSDGLVFRINLYILIIILVQQAMID